MNNFRKAKEYICLYIENQNGKATKNTYTAQYYLKKIEEELFMREGK